MMIKVLFTIIYIFIISFVILYYSKKETFIAGGGTIEFFYKRDCDLCSRAKAKLLKRLDRRTSFVERNLTRIKCKKKECSTSGKVTKCVEVTYEDWENCEDAKRAESLSITYTPTIVITGGNAIVIITLDETQVNRM